MKKLIALILCAAMLCALLPASAEEVDSLPEKMLEQIEYASGIKSTLRYSVSGESPLAKLLSPLADIDIGLWMLIDWSTQYDATLFALDGEEKIAVTRLWGNTENAIFQSEALEKPVVLPVDGDVTQALLNIGEEQNAPWYAIALNLLRVEERDWKDKWQPALAPYESAVELWLSRYGDAPILTPDAGTGRNIMALTYTVPVDDLKEEIKLLLRQALADETLGSLMRKQMTDAQQAIYWNPNLAYYYESAVDGLYMEGDVVLEREMSALGDEISLSAQFPIPENSGMWNSLRIEREGETLRAMLVGEDRRIDFSATPSGKGEKFRCRGELQITRQVDGDDQGFAAAYDFSGEFSTYEDADTYTHEVTACGLTLTPSGTLEHNSLTGPGEITANFDFYSKYGKRSSTRLAWSLEALLPDTSLNAAGNLRTTSPWEIVPLSAEDGVRWTDLTRDEQSDLLSAWAQRLLSLLSRLKPMDLPEPEPATPADIG